ncbi:MAG: hypothetical protein U0R71_06900 [Solirubrobacterales bacterium]
MPARIASALVLGTLAAAVLIGCGGDTRRAETEAGTEAAPPGVTQSQQPSGAGPVRVTRVADPARRAYVTRIDAICKRLDSDRASQQERVGSSPDTAEAVRTYDDSIALGWRELRMVEAVPPPPGDAAVLKANVFEPIRSQLALRAEMSRALAATDVPRLRQLRSELDDSARALTGFARGYGFRVCGEA